MAWAGGEKARVRVRVRARVTRVTQVTRVGVGVGVAGSRTGGGPGRRPGLGRTRASTRPPSGTTTGRTRQGRRWTAPRAAAADVREGRGREAGGRGTEESVGREVRGWGEGETGGGAATARRGGAGEFIGEEMRAVPLVTFVSSSSSGVGFLSGGGREPFSSTRGLSPGNLARNSVSTEPCKMRGSAAALRLGVLLLMCSSASRGSIRAIRRVCQVRASRCHSAFPLR